jgi:hypothetical protein
LIGLPNAEAPQHHKSFKGEAMSTKEISVQTYSLSMKAKRSLKGGLSDVDCSNVIDFVVTGVIRLWALTKPLATGE